MRSRPILSSLWFTTTVKNRLYHEHDEKYDNDDVEWVEETEIQQAFQERDENVSGYFMRRRPFVGNESGEYLLMGHFAVH